SFLVDIDITELACSSDSSTPTYPPGFEPTLEEVTDDVSSRNYLDNDPQPVIPVKLKNKWKRLGISVEAIHSPASRTRRAATNGNYSLQ
ncbi:hypothetical protein MKX01_037403, partial [Papaver californicum]